MKLVVQEVIRRQLGAILFVTSLASGGVLCAPQPVGSASAVAPATTASAASSNQQTSKPGAPAVSGAQQASAESAASQREGATSTSGLQQTQKGHANQLNTFDGRNPFGDLSLWQVPINLVRDFSDSGDLIEPVGLGGRPDELMAKSASEMLSADERDELSEDSDGGAADHRDGASSMQHLRPAGGVSSAPTVISASTDLKTAAGYHHAMPHHGYEHHDHHHQAHEPSHYAGHHEGHYGKYFQYASSPYPYAWDFGYRRGNPYHTIERYEHAKGPHFQTKVKWSDKYGGHGVQVWDYNHDDHHGHHYDAEEHGAGHYDSHAPTHHYDAGHHGHGHGHYAGPGH